ncbi:hypothetical protein [Rhodovulum adriaticum]|uniref:PemK-like, MazF-like toxin of type II toxin-antitoxin system n=1 Tax=Rhodovulum adriaticum TaxID=35804 RepID=A0A4R2NFJ5_RHOAD|nr:hypothetical protein [Rhodovulum adriaticum]MBK1637176.1 hypothetical protein [Rhodovulum adriaticum]TCP19958.1 hypothetical protein EV656_1248 [Rhodovulum adriaticum]
MLDQTRSRPPAPDWSAALSHGTVLSCRFPLSPDAPKRDAPPRPCLVLDIETLGGRRFAVIAPGLPRPDTRQRGLAIDIADGAELVRAGLWRPIRFLADKRLLISVGNTRVFPARDTTGPVRGRLSGASFERMNAVRARLHAERDIAAERRRDRDAARRHRPAPALPHRLPARSSPNQRSA